MDFADADFAKPNNYTVNKAVARLAPTLSSQAMAGLVFTSCGTYLILGKWCKHHWTRHDTASF